MSSKLQLDIYHINQWWRHLVNVMGYRQVWCNLRSVPERLECEPINQSINQSMEFVKRPLQSWTVALDKT